MGLDSCKTTETSMVQDYSNDCGQFSKIRNESYSAVNYEQDITNLKEKIDLNQTKINELEVENKLLLS